MKQYKKVLSIAGSDSGGGAGIQADLKTVSALSCYGATVITALTAQNTTGVSEVHEVPVPFVISQAEAVLDDIGADAIKIGMLWSPEMIAAVGELIKRYDVKNVVFDPVMVAQSGDSLVKGNIEDAMKEHLLPLSTVFTPNLPEAERFLGAGIHKLRDMEKAAFEFIELGCSHVLVKGGHLEGDESVDVFLSKGDRKPCLLKERRIQTVNNHGTGCTLSSAIAAFLARGYSPEKAVGKAKEYITKALHAGAEYKIGSGSGPVKHFF